MKLNESACGRVAGSSWPASCSGIGGEPEISKNSHLVKRAENKSWSENLNGRGLGARFGKAPVKPNPGERQEKTAGAAYRVSEG
ncbi:hypothetical protein DSJ_22895 (plasmid) [Pantoea stewartii subsp. stewartii DC283]|uniref:Uncharacterized protein n=1 Tax=Pantoea stewartii subsp. stewartii DC283 TaxID=660596 RepID=H3RM52_PANSE|nr:hypothetical protein DSJ_22895 [Pantoea stewartii subsp. stewartii DC283]EHT97560.1 hypothetical protein CKS_5649 [Pantoea stewartii subsp. stewartii DC283]